MEIHWLQADVASRLYLGPALGSHPLDMAIWSRCFGEILGHMSGYRTNSLGKTSGDT